MPTAVNFAVGGLGGLIGWAVVHPFNTVGVRMSLATATGNTTGLGFVPFFREIVRQEGALALYNGLSAGFTRQLFYCTARLGLYDVMRDQVQTYREIDIWARLGVGVVSGGVAALISCPAEVSLVRMSNDNALPLPERRSYTSVLDAARRITAEEGITAFWRGSLPFVTRAMLVGCCQVGTFDHLKQTYRKMGITGALPLVFGASMTSGLIYSVITMPFETTKNRMAFQRPDPATGILPYRSIVQTMTCMAKAEGVLSLWNGFAPYYLRCGGFTVVMFMTIEQLKDLWSKMA
ncbi:mitochondrial carrier domain-containing protein [Baffinella frigidus]|nr:mitochondrial carrier domain-containing protein [Cryptophyta sp. CCMP2293]